MLRRPRYKLGNTSARGCKITEQTHKPNKNYLCSLKWERKREIIMMTLTELLAMNNFMTNAAAKITVTDAEVRATEAFKEKKAKADANNIVWKNTIAVIKNANANISDADAAATAAAMLATSGITKEVSDSEIISEVKEAMLAEKKASAQLEAMSQLGESVAQLKVLQQMMGGSETIVATPAPAPAPAESRMTMAERKAYIRDMVGSGTGTNQFRRHCDTTAQANAARAKIEQWRSLGYITGGQKAELRAEVNAAAWLGHCGVTATR